MWQDPPAQDEPTAHLDIQAVESLAECLKQWSGAALLVSHDQHFVASAASQVRMHLPPLQRMSAR